MDTVAKGIRIVVLSASQVILQPVYFEHHLLISAKWLRIGYKEHANKDLSVPSTSTQESLHLLST